MHRMGCWVVPTIAAEFWRVSVEHVMHGIRTGQIPSKTEDGFTFVQAIPESANPAEKKPTFVEVPAEISATEDEELPPIDDESSVETADWRSKRAESRTLRRGPAIR